ncbi:MAG TPA: ferric reductase-like transmembrane domain-containing protein [Ktedonobacterales bacterium]|nr:ferric reductase-like transmembrane domain-containing protein [Ktedonobacterales bacterium]
MSIPAVLSSLSVTLAATTSTANPFLWYVTRAAAVSAYVTLSATVILGLLRSLARVSRLRNTRALWLLDELHPYLAMLTVAFVVFHLLSLIFDPLIPFSLLNLALPLDQPYRPLPVDLGVLALYGLLVVWLSSWMKRRIAYASWRTLHYTSFIAFLLVTLHGIFAGSDSAEPWMILLYLGISGAVGILVLARIFWPAPQPTSASRVVASRRSR